TRSSRPITRESSPTNWPSANSSTRPRCGRSKTRWWNCSRRTRRPTPHRRRTGAVAQTLPTRARRLGLGTALRRVSRARTDARPVLGALAQGTVVGTALRPPEVSRRTRSRCRLGVADHAGEADEHETEWTSPTAAAPVVTGGGPTARPRQPEGGALSTERATGRAHRTEAAWLTAGSR